MKTFTEHFTTYLASALWRHFGVRAKELETLTIEELEEKVKVAIAIDALQLRVVMILESFVKALS